MNAVVRACFTSTCVLSTDVRARVQRLLVRLVRVKQRVRCPSVRVCVRSMSRRRRRRHVI